MVSNNPVLETLAAFAIVFATGVLFTVAFAKYIEKVRSDVCSDVQRADQSN